VLRELERGVLNPAAGMARGVPVDETAFQVRAVAADSCQAQPGGVKHPVVPAALQQHRVFRRGIVEFGGGGQAAVREPQLMPVGGGADPLPRRCLRCPLPDQLDKPRYVRGLGDGYAEDVLCGQHEVVVGVDEGGQHDEPRVIDHDGAGAAPGGEQVTAVVRPGRRGDRAVADGERRDRGGARGHRVHRARSDDEVGSLVAHVPSGDRLGFRVVNTIPGRSVTTGCPGRCWAERARYLQLWQQMLTFR